MAKNYMQDVAKMLGVELGEEFMIEDADGYLIDTDFYRITKVGCFYRASDNSKNNGVGNGKLLGILQGQFKIRKLPWQPKTNEAYYRPAYKFFGVASEVWTDNPYDYAFKEAGMIFKTKKECEAALPNMRAKYLSETGADR